MRIELRQPKSRCERGAQRAYVGFIQVPYDALIEGRAPPAQKCCKQRGGLESHANSLPNQRVSLGRGIADREDAVRFPCMKAGE